MTATVTKEVAVGSLVRARGREWVVLPGTTPDFLLLQPLGGDEVVGVFPDEGVEPATFPLPTAADLGDCASGSPPAPGRSGPWPESASARAATSTSPFSWRFVRRQSGC